MDRRHSAGEPCEDPPDDLGLRFVDFEQFALHLLVRVKSDDVLVTIGPPSSEAFGQHGGLHAAQRLVDEMLQKDRTKQAGPSRT